MPVETDPLFPYELDATSPTGSESRRDGDDHLRNIKAVIKAYLKAETGTRAYDEVDLLQAMYPTGICVLSHPAGAAVNGLEDDIGGSWSKLGTFTLDDGVSQIDVFKCTAAPNSA
jgi:hypothetical protein